MPEVGFDHVILTRFSVRPYPASPPHSSAWLEHRMDLLGAYGVTSMSAQTCKDFTWLVFCDESTQPWCLERLNNLRHEVPQLRIVLTSPTEPSYLAAVQHLRPGNDVLITTRVDSDDASSIDLVERIQRLAPSFVASGQKAALMSFARGFKFVEDERALYECWNPHSAHLSLFEHLDPTQQPITVQSGNHCYLPEQYPIHVDAGPSAWMQVIHGGNVHNRIWVVDREVPVSALSGRFALRPDRERVPAVAPDQPRTEDRRIHYRQALEESLLGSQSDRRRAPGRQRVRDRITEVYEGEFGEPEHQAAARNRVDWMCEQARGRTLDVGCSQGIATIVLARRGISCIGIDHELDQVSTAVTNLAEEDPDISRHARFVAADAAGLPFADGYFETVLLGGVLGRLKDPARVLTECRRVLAPSGRLVITTPFGADPHEDLRSVFFPASLAELVEEHATLVSLEIVDHHIRLVAEADGEGHTSEMVREAQPQIDAIHHAQQRELHALHDEFHVLRDRFERNKVRADRLAARVEKRDRQLEKRDRQLERLKVKAERLERRLARSQAQVEALRSTRWYRLGTAVRRVMRPFRGDRHRRKRSPSNG